MFIYSSPNCPKNERSETSLLFSLLRFVVGGVLFQIIDCIVWAMRDAFWLKARFVALPLTRIVFCRGQNIFFRVNDIQIQLNGNMKVVVCRYGLMMDIMSCTGRLVMAKTNPMLYYAISVRRSMILAGNNSSVRLSDVYTRSINNQHSHIAQSWPMNAK